MATKTITVHRVDTDLLVQQLDGLANALSMAEMRPEDAEALEGAIALLGSMLDIAERPDPTPTVKVSLQGGLLLIEEKTEGCILILRDFDACDPEQGEEEMDERRATCEVLIDEAGDEYQLTQWGPEASVHDDLEVK